MIIHDLRRFVNSFLRIFSVPFHTRMLFSEAPALRQDPVSRRKDSVRLQSETHSSHSP